MNFLRLLNGLILLFLDMIGLIGTLAKAFQCFQSFGNFLPHAALPFLKLSHLGVLFLGFPEVG